jgi:hypothetical protein
MTGEGAVALVSRVAVQEMSSAKRCRPTCNITRAWCGTVVTSGVPSRFGRSTTFLHMSCEQYLDSQAYPSRSLAFTDTESDYPA